MLHQPGLHIVTSDSGSSTTLAVEVELRDDPWARFSGEFQRAIRHPNCDSVVIDFSRVGWSDPQPLLALSCCLREFEVTAEGRTIEILLGAPRGDDRDRFLRFFANQGFLKALTCNGIFHWNGTRYLASDNSEMVGLFDQLSSLMVPAAYERSECIVATIFDIGNYNQATTENFVEELVNRAHQVGIESWLPKQSRHRAFLLQKVRVILTELIDNVVEHAYDVSSCRFGGVYARIRNGAPDDATSYAQWQRHRHRETAACPTLNRANFGKKPGWLELFVCDIGQGLMRSLSEPSDMTPLRTNGQKVFRYPISRYSNRAKAKKLSVTGLQHIGFVMEAGPEEPIRNDFVRIYSSGEWIGEHFPWPPESLSASHKSYRSEKAYAEGTYFAFSLEPPVSSFLPATEVYPPFFFVPNKADLSNVRKRLAEPMSLFSQACGFSDQLPNHGTAQRGPAIRSWISALDRDVSVVRPARTLRKADLLDLLAQLARRVRTGTSKLKTLIFADVPTFLAIDLAYLLRDSRQDVIWPSTRFKLFIVTQDWCVACYRVSSTLSTMESDAGEAREFIVGQMRDFCAADVASLLRTTDSILFWQAAGEAYINEPIRWDSSKRPVNVKNDEGDLFGYLDLPQALVYPACFHAAQRALRRTLKSHQIDAVLTADGLVGSLLTDDFINLDGGAAVEGSRNREVVVAGSIAVSGSTTRQFQDRRDVVVTAITHLLTRADPIAVDGGTTDFEETIALEWSPPQRISARKKRARIYERIPGTAFIIRGGEGAIPLPRFAEPKEAENVYSHSYYGENPNEAYEIWQKRGLLKFGHWVYGSRHDLLTINLFEAIRSDSSGKIVGWLVSVLAQMKEAGGDILLLYPSHLVTERIIRELQNRPDNPIEKIYALKIMRSQTTSPFLVSPVERDRLGEQFRQYNEKTTVVIFDDGTVTGKSLLELQQLVQATWRAAHRQRGIHRPEVDIRTVALLDRTGLPTHRLLVEAEVQKHPRLWRWDVPGLGNDRTCPLCSSLFRSRRLRGRITDRDLVARLELWESHWHPVSVTREWSDSGLPPEILSAGDKSHFGIENRPDGRKVAHEVRHRVTTSRASLAAEIFRSTTRKTYPLEKATSGRSGEGRPLSTQARIEILCATIFLFIDDLNYQERSRHFETLLDLLWNEETSNSATEIAGLALLLPEGTLARDLMHHLSGLIELHGIKNDDALLVASSLTWETGGHFIHGIKHENTGWSLVQMVTSSATSLRGALSRIFQVIGWGPHSFHAGWLVRFFATNSLVRKPHDVQLMAIMLEALATALNAFPVECTVSENVNIVDPVDDARRIREYLDQLRQLADYGENLPLSSRYEYICRYMSEKLNKILEKISNCPGRRPQCPVDSGLRT